MKVEKFVLNDVEELAFSVDPWELRMDQMSLGNFVAEMQVARLGDIFVSSEYWSRKIAATGLNPSGYLALSGPLSGAGFSWCGKEINDQRLVCAPDSKEVDFLTGDREHHWTLLIPKQSVQDYLGEEILDALNVDTFTLGVDSLLSRRLSSTIVDILSSTAEQPSEDFERWGRERILAAAGQLLLNAPNCDYYSRDRTNRARAYRKARRLLEERYESITVAELAQYAGVTPRCLEIGFKEATGLSPKTYMMRLRLNALHKELSRATPCSSSVTSVANKCGCFELGRTAARYRDMFGVLPSETLHHLSSEQRMRFSDVLSE